jgi:hypothetical protein
LEIDRIHAEFSFPFFFAPAKKNPRLTDVSRAGKKQGRKRCKAVFGLALIELLCYCGEQQRSLEQRLMSVIAVILFAALAKFMDQ